MEGITISPKEKPANGELLIFDYAPNLRVVGTYHALHNKDRETLESLIKGVDFVALEGVQSPKVEVALPLVMGARLYEDYVSVGFFNLLYILSIKRSLRKNVEEVNNRVNAKLLDRRDTNLCEFKFCSSTATAFGKRVYEVDMPVNEMFYRLCDMPFIKKLRQFWNNLLINYREISEYRNIFLDMREERMLRNIEKKEGISVAELQSK